MANATKPTKLNCKTCDHSSPALPLEHPFQPETIIESYLCKYFDYANLPTYHCDEWEAKGCPTDG